MYWCKTWSAPLVGTHKFCSSTLSFPFYSILILQKRADLVLRIKFCRDGLHERERCVGRRWVPEYLVGGPTISYSSAAFFLFRITSFHVHNFVRHWIFLSTLIFSCFSNLLGITLTVSFEALDLLRRQNV